MHPNLRPPQNSDAAWLLEALNDTRTNYALVDLSHPYPTNFIPEFWLDDTQPLLQFVWLFPLSSPPTCSGVSVESLTGDPRLRGDDDDRMGYIWFSVSDDNDNAEFSFLLHPKFQGQGLGLAHMPHIFAWLAQHMQASFNTNNISSHVRPSNVAAQTILSVCGFKLLETAEYPTANGNTLLQKWQFND